MICAGLVLVAVLAQLVVLVSSTAFGILTLAGISNGTVKPNGAPVTPYFDSPSCAALGESTCICCYILCGRCLQNTLPVSLQDRGPDACCQTAPYERDMYCISCVLGASALVGVCPVCHLLLLWAGPGDRH